MQSMSQVWKENKWKFFSIMFMLIIGLMIINNLYNFYQDKIEEEKNICSKIKATPAWADNFGNVKGYGVMQSLEGDNLVPYLIENKLKFIYHSDCSACQKQIKIFGNKWANYQDSGLTINCKNYNG